MNTHALGQYNRDGPRQGQGQGQGQGISFVFY
jgi:hypothetical protein